MPSEKRLRQDEGRLLRLEEQRVTSQRGQRKRTLRNLGFLLGGVLVIAGGIAILSGDDATDTDTTGTTTPGDSTSSTVPVAAEIVLPGAGAKITGDTPCPAADGSATRTTDFEKAPPMCIDAAKTYTATLKTTEGDVVIELDAAASPVSVNNFVVLARYHFYDNVAFHRIVPGFVDQAGDPVGPTPGVGGPGYTIPDEPPADPATAYAKGTVAMARTQAPNSTGSQFFLVIGDDGGALAQAGTYAVLGRIVEGQDVADTINTFGGAGDQADEPTKAVAITSVTITEG
jgi:cyclophilin family peptidyl-prolyl cis-trans isomerase